MCVLCVLRTNLECVTNKIRACLCDFGGWISIFSRRSVKRTPAEQVNCEIVTLKVGKSDAFNLQNLMQKFESTSSLNYCNIPTSTQIRQKGECGKILFFCAIWQWKNPNLQFQRLQQQQELRFLVQIYAFSTTPPEVAFPFILVSGRSRM